MKICFSICDILSENLRMPNHFGESEHFLLIDNETGKASPFPANSLPCRGPCHCHIPDRQNDAFNAVICRAIGHRELLALKKKGIPVFLTQETSPFVALQLWQENKLEYASRGICFKGHRKPSSAAAMGNARHATAC